MKRLALSLFIFLAATAAYAQVPVSTEEQPFVLRIGHCVHTGDPSGGVPYSSVALSADYHFGKALAGLTYEIPGGGRRTSQLEGRFGAGMNGRLRLAGFLSTRFLWEKEFSQLLIGSGISVDYRINGPCGIFASTTIAYPVMHKFGYAYTPYRAQLIFTYGFSLRF